jgi:YesN/AraC family two-component response regulator
MIFYEIELLSAPKILFAYNVESEKYRNSFYCRKDFLEISICIEGNMVFDHKDKKSEIAYPGMVVPILSDMNCDTYCEDNVKQCHVTVGARVSYNMRRYDNNSEYDLEEIEQRIKDGRTILMPHFYDPGERIATVKARLQKLIADKFSEDPASHLNAISDWYKLCALLTEIVYTDIKSSGSNILPSEHLYVNKAIRYIGQLNKSQASITDISAHLGISEGYLHRIFKKAMGCTVLEYINKQRVYAMIDLARNKKLTLREAAYNVGIEDPAYASRLFKKVIGTSFREFFAPHEK